MKRSRRKLGLLILVLLVAGKTINVAVACACARYSYAGRIGDELTAQDQRVLWTRFAPKEWSIDDGGSYLGVRSTGLGITQFEISDGLTTDSNGHPLPGLVNVSLSTRSIQVTQVGWPCRSMQRASAATILELLAAHDGYVDIARLRPLYGGFAINTIFYAAMVWVLFMFVPLKLRRWWEVRRIKRGLCPACAYPVGTNPRCTECGKPVK